jgi:hypothetical protein
VAAEARVQPRGAAEVGGHGGDDAPEQPGQLRGPFLGRPADEDLGGVVGPDGEPVEQGGRGGERGQPGLRRVGATQRPYPDVVFGGQP